MGETNAYGIKQGRSNCNAVCTLQKKERDRLRPGGGVKGDKNEGLFCPWDGEGPSQVKASISEAGKEQNRRPG